MVSLGVTPTRPLHSTSRRQEEGERQTERGRNQRKREEWSEEIERDRKTYQKSEPCVVLVASLLEPRGAPHQPCNISSKPLVVKHHHHHHHKHHLIWSSRGRWQRQRDGRTPASAHRSLVWRAFFVGTVVQIARVSVIGQRSHAGSRHKHLYLAA